MSSNFGTSDDEDNLEAGDPIISPVDNSDAADLVYHKAVSKLRLLLSASEEAAMRSTSNDDDEEEEEEFDDGGERENYLGRRMPFARSADHLNITEPRPVCRRKRTMAPKGGGGVRRALFQRGQKGQGGRAGGHGSGGGLHNSWHNLVQVGAANELQDPNAIAEEVALVRKQESYIAQLEKETQFCREQLANVLAQMREVLTEKEAMSRSEEANVYSTMLARWQSDVIAPGREEELRTLRLENARLRDQLTYHSSAGNGKRSTLTDRELAEKLKRDNATLTEAIKRLRAEAEEVARREGEAAEQVKSSVQVAEALRMEKAELEYETIQAKAAIDRQQAKIRALIEEQADRVEGERVAIEKRAGEQVRAAREEAARQAQEATRLEMDLEKQIRMEGDMRLRLTEEAKIRDEARQAAEKKIEQLQIESVAQDSARQRLEQEMVTLRMDLQRAEHETKEERSRTDVDSRALKNRITRAEDSLEESRREMLELAEAKAALESELNTLRVQSVEGLGETVFAGATTLDGVRMAREEARKATVTRLEELIRRQSRIIGELKYECTAVTDKLEEAVRAYADDKAKLEAANERLRRSAEDAKMRRTEMEARLSETGVLQERLCRKLEETDIERSRAADELRQSYLKLETVRQEKKVVELEVDFLNKVLRSKGLLPEKDTAKEGPPAKKEKNVRNRRTKTASVTDEAIQSQAIVIQ